MKFFFISKHVSHIAKLRVKTNAVFNSSSNPNATYTILLIERVHFWCIFGENKTIDFFVMMSYMLFLLLFDNWLTDSIVWECSL